MKNQSPDLQRLLHLAEALEHERSQEEAYFREIALNKTIKERVESGVLWYPAQIDNLHYSIAEKLEVVTSPLSIKTNAKRNRLRVGNSAILWILHGEERKEWKGVISYVSRNKISIIMNQDHILKEHISNSAKCGIELIYDDRPYRVMFQTLETVAGSSEPAIVDLRNGLANRNLKERNGKQFSIPLSNSQLNPSQIEAIQGVAQADRMGVIHGPPGTGKTTTIVDLVKYLLQTEKRVLVCAPSNNAVDLLTRRISAQGISTLRMGNVTRIGDSIAHLCLDEQVRQDKEWQHIKQVRIEAEAAHTEANRHKRKFGHQQRQERKILRREARELSKWARQLENRLVDKIIQESQVVCTTLIGTAHSNLDGLQFETVIIDEASQALEPESWTAILKGQRVIMAGDPMQLPPTVKSREADKMGLAITMLDTMVDAIEHKYLLNTQYRMHPDILGFSNQEFYNGALQTADFVKDRKITNDNEVVTIIDTSGCGFEEKTGPEGRSYSNKDEYFIIREHLVGNEDLVQPGLSIGIISPYAYQVNVIRKEVQEDESLRLLDIEVNSIDGFQGQEKDVIYISLVRSNDRGEVGFLKDSRRLNVALTRAKYKLVIVGDWATLANEGIYNRLADHVEENGTYKSAWEYMK